MFLEQNCACCEGFECSETYTSEFWFIQRCHMPAGSDPHLRSCLFNPEELRSELKTTLKTFILLFDAFVSRISMPSSSVFFLGWESSRGTAQEAFLRCVWERW